MTDLAAVNECESRDRSLVGPEPKRLPLLGEDRCAEPRQGRYCPSRALRAGCARNPTQPGQRRKLGAANGLSPLALQRSAESSALAAPARIVAAREDSQGIAMQRSGASGQGRTRPLTPLRCVRLGKSTGAD